MNDHALMEIATRVDPVTPDAYRGLADTEWGRGTFDTIVASARPRRRWIRGLAAAAAAVGVIAGAVAVTSTDPSPPKRRLWAPRLVRMAQASPRLLVTAPGWKVTRADGFGTEYAEMSFENERYWVDIHWYSADLYELYVDDRRRGADGTGELQVAGSDALLFRHDYTATQTTFYALWLAGPHAIELRSDVVPSTAEFRAIAKSVDVVDVDRWLAALPESVVKPDERRRVVERAAADLPIPPELDLDAIAEADVVGEQYSLEFEVATAVACGWIDHWAAGGEAAKREAVEALAGAHDWRAFRDGNLQVENIGDVAAAMAEGEAAPGDPAPSRAAGYRRHLGCEGS